MAQTNGALEDSSAQTPPLLFVGGVGQLYQGDLDVGRIVVERLQEDHLESAVVAEDLYYGAIAVCQRLQDLRPSTLVLVGATARGHAPGTVTRVEVGYLARTVDEFRQAVAEAATGYVSIDLILEVASAFRALPERTVVIEIEPHSVDPCETLSDECRPAVDDALELIHREIGRLQVLS